MSNRRIQGIISGLFAAGVAIAVAPVYGAFVLSTNARSDAPGTREVVICCGSQDGYLSARQNGGGIEVGLCLSLEDDSERGEAIKILFEMSAPASGMALPNLSISQTTAIGAGGALSGDRFEGSLPTRLVRYFSLECRSLLPNGPSSRWFRPPRV